MHPTILLTYAELVTADRQRRAAVARVRGELVADRRRQRAAVVRATLAGIRRPVRPATSTPSCCPA